MHRAVGFVFATLLIEVLLVYLHLGIRVLFDSGLHVTKQAVCNQLAVVGLNLVLFFERKLLVAEVNLAKLMAVLRENRVL